MVAVFALAPAVAAAAAPASEPHRVVLAIAEDEYDAHRTLLEFAAKLAADQRLRLCVLQGRAAKTDLPGLEALDSADLLVLYLRRTELPAAQLQRIRCYLRSGGALIGIRTSSHAFQNWLEFDRELLGMRYDRHHGNREGTPVSVLPARRDHPVVQGLPDTFHSPSWLYRYDAPAEDVTVLMTGRWGDAEEPVAWVRDRTPGRVFYTSLGHPGDFELEPFRRLLAQAVYWALGLEPSVPGSGEESR